MKFYVAATSGMFLYCVAVLLGGIEIFSTFFFAIRFSDGGIAACEMGYLPRGI